jgi:hypothetical protein
MKKFKQEKKPNMDGINLLVSILVCYPEIGTISFEPKDDSLNLAFALVKVPEKEDFNTVKEFITDSILTYHILEGFRNAQIDVSLEAQDGTAFLHIIRDVATISQGELGLISVLIRDHFGKILLCDAEQMMTEEDGEGVQEDVIDHMIGSLKINHIPDRMIGIREEGRVMVFNK